MIPIARAEYNKIYEITLSEDGATEPVTLAEAQDYIRTDADGTYILALISIARSRVEQHVHRSLIERTITLYGALFCEFELPYGDATNVAATDDDGNALVEDTDFKVIGNQFKRFVPLTTGKMTLEYDSNGIVPPQLKQAVLAEISYLYDNRGDENKDEGLCKLSRQLSQPFVRIIT